MKNIILTILALFSINVSAQYSQSFRIIDVQANIVLERYQEPYTDCQSGYYDRQYRNDHRSSTSDRVVGAVIGGAIGRQFGNGRGRDAATIAGAVIGSEIARNNHDRNHGYSRGYYQSRPQCRTYYRTRVVERENGYNITYDYYGSYRTIWMSYVPSGNYIRL